MRALFMYTCRLAFGRWEAHDTAMAYELWGDKRVTRFIGAPEGFSAEQTIDRLRREITTQTDTGASYWPVFDSGTMTFLGCCGVTPWEDGLMLGFHLLPRAWGRGIATEAGDAALRWAFTRLKAERVYAGHHPLNLASKRVLEKLGFRYLRDAYYAPTGLMHPIYEMTRAEFEAAQAMMS